MLDGKEYDVVLGRLSDVITGLMFSTAPVRIVFAGTVLAGTAWLG